MLLDLLYLFAFVCYLPILFVRVVFVGKDRRGWRERFGFVAPHVGTRPRLWVHGVSLGEVNATRSLVAELHRRLPRYEIVLSATTQTGYDAAVRNHAPQPVVRFPLDFSWVVRRALDRIRPEAILLMELEVWPNLLAEAARRGIPIMIANGRVTAEKSMRRFSWPIVGGVARRMFARLAWVAAQDETYAERFRALGVPAERVFVTGSVKYDTALVADTVTGADQLAETLEIDPQAPLWVAGSTGPGEEAVVLEAFETLRREFPALQLAIVPRKPERFDEVAALIASRGHACVRRSERPDLAGQDARAAERQKRHARYRGADRPADTSPRPIILGDTMGELRKFYALASVVFVGRTLVPLGGSDVMEVAGLGKAMVIGPHVENFADAVSRLLAANAAAHCDGPGALAPAVGALLRDAATRGRMGAAAREVVRQNVGATRRTVDLLCGTLGLDAEHPERTIATRVVPDRQRDAEYHETRSVS